MSLLPQVTEDPLDPTTWVERNRKGWWSGNWQPGHPESSGISLRGGRCTVVVGKLACCGAPARCPVPAEAHRLGHDHSRVAWSYSRCDQ